MSHDKGATIKLNHVNPVPVCKGEPAPHLHAYVLLSESLLGALTA